MESAMKELVSSGAVGATLVVALVLLSWLVKVLVASFIRQTEAVIKAVNELVEASRAIRDNCRACRSDSITSLRDVQVAIESKIEHVAWAVHDKAFSENKDLLAGATKALETTLTGVASSIRESNKDMELSRPHDITPRPSGVVR